MNTTHVKPSLSRERTQPGPTSKYSSPQPRSQAGPASSNARSPSGQSQKYGTQPHQGSRDSYQPPVSSGDSSGPPSSSGSSRLGTQHGSRKGSHLRDEARYSEAKQKKEANKKLDEGSSRMKSINFMKHMVEHW